MLKKIFSIFFLSSFKKKQINRRYEKDIKKYFIFLQGKAL